MSITKQDNKSGSYGLRHHVLSPLETLGQSVANIAPTATPTVVIPLVFAISGAGTWLAYLFATISVLLVATSINAFASRSASPGSFYSYTITGLGPFWGSVTGWALLIAYIGCASAVTSGFSNYSNEFIGSVTGQKIPSVLWISLCVLLAWYVAYKDIKLSARLSLLLEFASVSLILFLVGITLYRYGFRLDWDQLTLKGINPNALRGGLVLAIFSFVGFESAATLGSEASNPLQSIPRAIVRSALLVGGLFVISSYAQVIGFEGYSETLDKSSAPLSVLAERAGLSSLGLLINVGAVISFFACVLASINSGARVLFLMGHHGQFHSSTAKVHESNETPHKAVTIVSVIAFIPAAILSIRGVGDFDIYGWVGTVATLGFITTYGIVSIAALAYLKQRGELKVWNIIASVVAVFLLGLAILGNLYPVPPAPYNILPYIFFALLLGGAVWIGSIHRIHPTVSEEVRRDAKAIQDRFIDGGGV
jgi:amino acid transporter